MANTPWMTSDKIIESIKRRISFPISQATFSEDDILKFVNEEMTISQVPSVLSFHEEYFVTTKAVALEQDKSRYSIPDRAIGMKLRDVFFQDSSENLFEMTRISPDERAYFQGNVASSQSLSKFYFEGNEIVLIPKVSGTPSGSLLFVYFLRPNQIVKTDRAGIIKYFVKNVIINNASMVAGDTLTIDGEIFTAVAGSPSTNEFQIGATSIATASNIVNAVNNNGIAIASNSSPATNEIAFKYIDLKLEFSTSNASGFDISSLQTLELQDAVPSVITTSSLVDFLQTKPGHKTKGMSVVVEDISTNNISFASSDVPEDLIIGDYICLENECIIPQIPTDLHGALCERTCARILAAIGDQAGLQASNEKIQEMELRTGSLIDNRGEGSPQKIIAKNSLLRHGRIGPRRRI